MGWITTIVLALTMMLTGCAGYSLGFGLSYTDSAGRTIGATTQINSNDSKAVKPFKRESGFAK